MCREKVVQQTVAFKVKKLVVMGGTKSSFDKNNNSLRTEFEIVEEMEYLICRYMTCDIKVTIIGLIRRRNRCDTLSD